MAETRYKIINTTKYNIGIKKPGNVEESIRSGGFTYLTQDDIQYEAFCFEKWLRSGELKAEDQAVYDMFGVDKTEAVVAMTDAEILEKFKMPMKAFAAWVDSLSGDAVCRRVGSVAADCDTLSIKKLELIEKKTGMSIRDARMLQGGDE